jgi:hypothetical protein
VAHCVHGQIPVFDAPLDHPAIRYHNGPAQDAVSELNRRLETGRTQLGFDAQRGYLSSVLTALRVPAETQTLVFSKTSLQSRFIHPGNPRAIYFNDAVAVAWVPGAPLLELASVDPERGVLFYTLEQSDRAAPRFQRTATCLQCHETALNVPGMLSGSHATAGDGAPRFHLGVYASDHRSPIGERWGGRYVTGAGGLRHMGREPRFAPSGYPSKHSNAAMLLLFDHQMHMTNLLVRAAWESRVILRDGRPRDPLTALAAEIARYMLFTDEAPLPAPIAGPSAFGQGPTDSRGRGLRQLDLRRRILRYPCSYVIYSELFDAIPAEMREAIYAAMWKILSQSHPRLTAADRTAVVEILRETKPGLPAYFKTRCCS